jgi:hypothetical protein
VTLHWVADERLMQRTDVDLSIPYLSDAQRGGEDTKGDQRQQPRFCERTNFRCEHRIFRPLGTGRTLSPVAAG